MYTRQALGKGIVGELRYTIRNHETCYHYVASHILSSGHLILRSLHGYETTTIKAEQNFSIRTIGLTKDRSIAMCLYPRQLCRGPVQ